MTLAELREAIATELTNGLNAAGLDGYPRLKGYKYPRRAVDLPALIVQPGGPDGVYLDPETFCWGDVHFTIYLLTAADGEDAAYDQIDAWLEAAPAVLASMTTAAPNAVLVDAVEPRLVRIENGPNAIATSFSFTTTRPQ